MFQQLLANKHHRLRDFKAPITIWPSGGLGLVTDKKTKKKKSRVKQEPRSAHGRAVNQKCVLLHPAGKMKKSFGDRFFSVSVPTL